VAFIVLWFTVSSAMGSAHSRPLQPAIATAASAKAVFSVFLFRELESRQAGSLLIRRRVSGIASARQLPFGV
jgi:hypothetical protein